MAKKKWIKGAIRHPGSLRATAKREGALHNGISKSWLRGAAKRPGVTGRRARLAITLGKMSHKRRK